MKKNLLILLIIVFTNSFLFGQNVKVTDYQVPISTAKNLFFNGSWDWAQRGDTVKNNTYNGNVVFRTFYSSLPFAWFINGNARFDKSYNEIWEYSVSVSPEIRKYVWEDLNWFAFSNANVSWRREKDKKRWDKPESDLTIGGGYGRLINATALAKAVRIEGHLLKEGVIKGYMPKEIMIEIAKIIERKEEYRDLHGPTYEIQWLNDIEQQIRESGELIGDYVGAMGVFRIRQVLFELDGEVVNDRYYGWDIKIGAKFELTKRYDSLRVGSPRLSVGAGYSYPISWNTQINAGAEGSLPVDSNFFKETKLNANADFIYELSNRVNFLTTYIFELEKKLNIGTEINHIISSSFIFYIENQIYYIVTGELRKPSGRIKNDPTVLGIKMTLQYRLF